jgi:DNA-directed RNA polymerase subunit K/omega
MISVINTRSPWLLIAAVVLVGAVSIALAEPGGKDDPLITAKYAQTLASFQLKRVGANQALKLRSGAELVIVSPDGKPVNAAGIGEKTPLLNLSTGERVVVTAMRANQHYVYAGDAELALRFDAPVTCLVRGEAR